MRRRPPAEYVQVVWQMDSIPEAIVEASVTGDVPRLLRFWEEEAWPIPDKDFVPTHPLFTAVHYVSRNLDLIAAERMSPEEALATEERLRFLLAGEARPAKA